MKVRYLGSRISINPGSGSSVLEHGEEIVLDDSKAGSLIESQPGLWEEVARPKKKGSSKGK